MKIVYLASLLTYDGVEHIGRSLARHLSTEHEMEVFGAIVEPDCDLLNGRVGDWVMSAGALDEIDVVYMEGGWTDGSGSATERFPLALAESFVFGGGQLFVADVNRHEAQKNRESLQAAVNLFGALVSYGEAAGYRGIRYLHDGGAEEQWGTRFFTNQMYVSEKLLPAMTGIDSILTQSAVQLDILRADIAASGNRSTRVLVNDLLVDTAGFIPGAAIAPWASVSECGHGHAVLIGANISGDVHVDHCPDNARWISNLMTLLNDRSRETAGWTPRKSRRTQTMLNLRTLLDQSESQILERKSSFLVSPETKQLETFLPHMVGKSIAALANTDGGYVIIGQDDHGNPLGLGSDFAVVKGGDRDGFEQKLTEYADNHLTPRWETLGLHVHWIEAEVGDIAVVEVPQQPKDTVVMLKKSKGSAEELYVRRGTRTDALTGRLMLDWYRARERR